MYTVSINEFLFNISEEKIGGTFLALIHSIMSFGRVIGYPIFIVLMDYMNFFYIGIIGISFEIYILYTFKKKSCLIQ